MEDIKESKKVLTDYMLELNADIQRAEDWANTGADEEMYFALKTVLDRLEQLEKENEELKYDNATLEKQVKIMRDNFTIAVEQQVNILLGGRNKMNLENILALKERAKEMLENNYDRKIGDEELYTIICEWENCYKENEELKSTLKCTQDSWFEDTKKIEEMQKELDVTDEANIALKIALDDSIPKSVIREKIEELEKNREEFRNNEENSKDLNEKIFWHSQFKEMVIAINVLKELLGGSNE